MKKNTLEGKLEDHSTFFTVKNRIRRATVVALAAPLLYLLSGCASPEYNQKEIERQAEETPVPHQVSEEELQQWGETRQLLAESLERLEQTDSYILNLTRTDRRSEKIKNHAYIRDRRRYAQIMDGELGIALLRWETERGYEDPVHVEQPPPFLPALVYSTLSVFLESDWSPFLEYGGERAYKTKYGVVRKCRSFIFKNPDLNLFVSVCLDLKSGLPIYQKTVVDGKPGIESTLIDLTIGEGVKEFYDTLERELEPEELPPLIPLNILQSLDGTQTMQTRKLG